MLYSNLYYMSICDPVASFSGRLLKQINPKLVEIVIRYVSGSFYTRIVLYIGGSECPHKSKWQELNYK